MERDQAQAGEGGRSDAFARRGLGGRSGEGFSRRGVLTSAVLGAAALMLASCQGGDEGEDEGEDD